MKVLTVANRIYQHVFHRDWVEKALKEADKRRIIRGRYEVLKDIKDGEFIKAYLVKDRDVPSQTPYIVKKLIPPAKDADTLAKIQTLFDERLQEQYKLNGYDQIPDLIASFEENQEFFTIQKFIDGHNLDEEIKPDKLWPETQVVDLLIQVLKILEFVHRQNLAHLNIQPSNLRRRKQDGKIVLIDFALLKEISASIASPEQIDPVRRVSSPDYALPKEAGDRSDVSRDIYTVGAIGIQALTGIHPRDFSIDKKTNEVIWRFATPDRPMVEVNNDLVKILTKIIRHNPDGRYLGDSEALDDLQRLKVKLQAGERYAWLRDKRVIAGSVAGLCVALIGGFIGYQGIARAKQINEQITNCENSFSLIQDDSVQPNTLVNRANAVQESCSTLIKAKNERINPYKHRGQANLVLRQADLGLTKEFNEEQDVKKLESILSDFEEANAMDKFDPQVSFYLGFYADLRNQPEVVTNYYNQAIKLYSENSYTLTQADFPILGELGRFLVQQYKGGLNPSELRQIQGIYGLAEKALRSSNSTLPEEGETNSNLSRIKYNLGILSARASNNVDAIENLEEAAKLDPGFELAEVALSFTQTVVGSGNSQDSTATFYTDYSEIE